MAESYVGEIRIFAGIYAPEKWHFCDGALLAISSYELLYALIGTTYGGDGVTNFALPDLQGCLPMGQGQGPGLTNRFLGEQLGVAEVPLDIGEMPAHTHQLNASADTAAFDTPAEYLMLAASGPADAFYFLHQYQAAGRAGLLADDAIGDTGNGNSHANIMPYMGLNFIICLTGIFPPQP